MITSESVPSPSMHGLHKPATRWLLILLMLLALARLVWRWDAKSLWWDESLSLQRAESSLPALLAGALDFDDGFTVTSTTDQHPPVYFLLLGGLIRLAGDSDFVLRFPAAAAAVLLVPATWAMARLLARRRVVPPATPLWAAGFMALNPFLLWYGREARMYTLVPLFALLSTYWLLRWTETRDARRARLYLACYALALVLLLGTHFLSLLILPVQAAVIFLHLARRDRRQAVVAAMVLLGCGLALAAASARWLLQGAESGSNFSRVPLPVLAADLLNAFSLGLSVDFARVRLLDYLFAAIAIAGALWPLRRPRSVPRDAWLLPALVVVPVLGLDVVQRVQPAYMNARHLSLVSAAFVLLVAAGCALAWRRSKVGGVLLGALLVAGMVYSTVNYFALPQYAQDDFAEVGADLAAEIQPGDGLAVLPVQMTRLYQHYLPLDALEADVPAGAGAARGWIGTPLLNQPFESTQTALDGMLKSHRRMWLVTSGMVPLGPYQEETAAWLASNAFLAWEQNYSSNTMLSLKLYLPYAPVLPELPEEVEHRVGAVFGDLVRLDGYDVGAPLTAGSATPITLYWQPLQKIDRRFKYALRLVSVAEDGSLQTLSTAEHEPYDGLLPTTWWEPGPEIYEYTGLPQAETPAVAPSSLRLAMQMYDAETLEKLPVTGTREGSALVDAFTVLMPFEP